MRAICIEEFGDTTKLHEITCPIPRPGREDVLVKIRAVGFNPVDTKMRRGAYAMKLPSTLGVDFSGVVEAVGDHSCEFSIGDEVFGFAPPQSSNGSYAEYIALPKEFICKKPGNLSFEEAAAAPVTYLTAFEGLIPRGVLQQNRPLFIAGGSGGVGSAAIALIQAYGGGPIFTLSGGQESTNYLRDVCQIPADQILSYEGLSQEEMVETLLMMNQNKGFYLVLDFVGKKVKELCFALADSGGHVVTILPEDEKDFPSLLDREGILWKKSLSLHMIFLFSPAYSKKREDWKIFSSQLQNLQRLFESRQLRPPFIEHIGHFSVETVTDGHKRLERGHTKGKLVMSVSRSS